jgi:bifunctional non-homologous end joining protein LigD
MPFIPPALASPWPGELPKGLWLVEEKLDGHRMVVERHDRGFDAWSRDGKERGSKFPAHIAEPLFKLPEGIYDGELLVPGGHSSDVTMLTKQGDLVLVLFDVLRYGGVNLIQGSANSLPLNERRKILMGELNIHGLTLNSVCVSAAMLAANTSDVFEIAEPIWNRGGEGIVAKLADSEYRSGKRMKQWLKLKTLESAVLTLTRYEPGLMGPNSVAVLTDDDGNEVPVKWKNHDWLDEALVRGAANIGRKVRIEFQERTRDGAYRHPRWDRWEDA